MGHECGRMLENSERWRFRFVNKLSRERKEIHVGKRALFYEEFKCVVDLALHLKNKILFNL